MRSSRAVTTPIPDVGGARNLLQVLTYDWRMFPPSLKLIAITVQKVCTIKNGFPENARSGPFSQIHSRVLLHSFSALNSTHLITEVPTFTSTFVLMLVVILLSLDDWWCRWRVFQTCEEEHLIMSIILCLLKRTAFQLSIVHTRS